MAKANTRVVGHGLVSEGIPHGDNGRPLWRDARRTGPGLGKCECGALSPWLTSAAARKRWHAEHKAAAATNTETEG